MIEGISLEDYGQGVCDCFTEAFPDLNAEISRGELEENLKNVMAKSPFLLIGLSDVILDTDCPDPGKDDLVGVIVRMYAFLGISNSKQAKMPDWLGRIIKKVHGNRLNLPRDACLGKDARFERSQRLQIPGKSGIQIHEITWTQQLFLDCKEAE